MHQLLARVATAYWLGSLHFIGTEFMPRLDEGSIVVTSRRLPGISLTESISLGKQIERVIMSFPEIKGVVTKLGRPDLATEAMGIYESDSYLTLNPQSTWKCCHSKDELIGKLSAGAFGDSRGRLRIHAADGDADGRGAHRYTRGRRYQDLR